MSAEINENVRRSSSLFSNDQWRRETMRFLFFDPLNSIELKISLIYGSIRRKSFRFFSSFFFTSKCFSDRTKSWSRQFCRTFCCSTKKCRWNSSFVQSKTTKTRRSIDESNSMWFDFWRCFCEKKQRTFRITLLKFHNNCSKLNVFHCFQVEMMDMAMAAVTFDEVTKLRFCSTKQIEFLCLVSTVVEIVIGKCRIVFRYFHFDRSSRNEKKITWIRRNVSSFYF